MMENANACLKSNDDRSMDSSSNNLDTEVMVLDDNNKGKVSFFLPQISIIQEYKFSEVLVLLSFVESSGVFYQLWLIGYCN